MKKQMENLNLQNKNVDNFHFEKVDDKKIVEDKIVGEKNVPIDVLDLALKTDGAEKGYNIVLNNKFLKVDEKVNQRLMAAGFTNEQVQLVYNLAGEVLLPQMQAILNEFQAFKELAKLENYFGGEEKFDEISRQLSLWAEQNLSPEIYASLNSTFYGVIALYNMMNSGDPKIMGKSMDNADGISEQKLKEMMQDPKYWRDGDKEFIKKVEDGFKYLYGNE